jgi:predicted DCC family thiol-disulfide oxidoreductase YuxK
MASSEPILLYDGVCGLCNRLVRFVLERDREGRFRFAQLQGPYAAAVLARHGRDAADLDTMYVVEHPGGPDERLRERARAALFVAGRLGWPWRALRVLGVLPTALLDLGYRAVAASRYRLFGRSASCPLPAPGWAERFVD